MKLINVFGHWINPDNIISVDNYKSAAFITTINRDTDIRVDDKTANQVAREINRQIDLMNQKTEEPLKATFLKNKNFNHPDFRKKSSEVKVFGFGDNWFNFSVISDREIILHGKFCGASQGLPFKPEHIRGIRIAGTEEWNLTEQEIKQIAEMERKDAR